jgi:hypothetical protein
MGTQRSRLNIGTNLAIRLGYPRTSLTEKHDGVYEDGSVSDKIKMEILEKLGWTDTGMFKFDSWCGDVNEGFLSPFGVTRTDGIKLTLYPREGNKAVGVCFSLGGTDYITEPFQSGQIADLFAEAELAALSWLEAAKTRMYITKLDESSPPFWSEEEGSWLLHGEKVKWHSIISPFFDRCYWLTKSDGTTVPPCQ